MKSHTLRIKIDEDENVISVSSNTLASLGDSELNFLPKYRINLGYYIYHFKLVETSRPERVLWVGSKIANELCLGEGQTVKLSLSDAQELSEATFERKYDDAVDLPELIPGIEMSIRDEYLHEGGILKALSAYPENGYMTSSTIIHINGLEKGPDDSVSIDTATLSEKQTNSQKISVIGFRNLYEEVKNKILLPFDSPEIAQTYLGKKLNAVIIKRPDGVPINTVINKMAVEANAQLIPLSIKKACASDSSEDYIIDCYKKALESPDRVIVHIYDTHVLSDSTGREETAYSAVYEQLGMTLHDENVITILEVPTESETCDRYLSTGQIQACIEAKHPTHLERVEFIKAYMPFKSELNDKDIQVLAKRMPGYSLIEIQQVMRQAGAEAMAKLGISSQNASITVDMMLKQVQEKNMSASGFGEFRMKLPKKSFEGLSGYDDLTKQLKDILDMQTGEREVKYDYQKNPNILFYGPPGTGKTHIAEGCAYYAGCSYLSLSAPQFMKKWVGESARNVRRLFKTAREQAPAIIHIDEIDAIVAHRENTYTAQVINQLRTEMEGINDNNGVIVIATTNHIDEIDAPILSRFNHQLHVDLPDEVALAKIIDGYFSPIDEVNFNPTDLAKMLIGHSPRKIREMRDKICHMLNTGEKTTIRMSDIMALIEYQTPKSLTTILNYRLS